MMQALVDHMDAHPLAGRILRGLEPDFTMRLLHIPALQELRKTVTELIRAQQCRRTRAPGHRSGPDGQRHGRDRHLSPDGDHADGSRRRGLRRRWPPTWSRFSRQPRARRSSNESAARPEIRTRSRAAASLLRAPSSRTMGIVRRVRSGRRRLPSRGARRGRRGGNDLVFPTNDHPISPRCLRGMPRFTCPPDGIDPGRRIRGGAARHLPGHLAQPWQRALWLLAG